MSGQRKRARGRSRPLWLGIAVAALAGGCVTAGAVTPGGAAKAAGAYATSPTSPGGINPAAVPLGDGYVSTRPRVGYVDSCVTHFGGIGGAQVDGPWINIKTKTWDYLTKIHVNGMIHWPQGRYTISLRGDVREIKFNDLPRDHPTGVFPIATSDPAFKYDHNANHIAKQSFDWKLTRSPRAAASAGCTNGGQIGVLEDGVVLFNALDGEGRDAGAHEVLDVCAGHPNPADIYHHHDIPPCILDKVPNGASRLVGYALDGYGIYVVKNKAGELPNNVQLDACHGTTSRVLWNGRMTRIYHYVATLEYPYTVGCFHGTPISAGSGGARPGGTGGHGGGPAGGGPPRGGG